MIPSIKNKMSNKRNTKTHGLDQKSKEIRQQEEEADHGGKKAKAMKN